MKKNKELFPTELFRFQPDTGVKIGKAVSTGPIGYTDDAPC